MTTREAYEFRYGNGLKGLALSERWWAPALFVLMALSCFLQQEPSPYDYGLLTLIGVFAISGPLLPTKLLWPAISVMLILTGYAIGSMFAVSFGDAFDYIKASGFLSVGFLFLAAIIWRSPERNGSAIVVGVLVSSVIAAMLGILGYFNLFVSPELYTEFGRATGTFVDPNVFAPALIFPTLYLLQRCAAQPKQGVWWCAPLMFLLLLAIFLSFSRGAWLNLVVSALFFWGLSYSSGNSSTRRRLVLFSMFTVTMMSAIVFWALSSADVSALFWERFSLTQSYDVAENGRFNNMYNALLAAGENPLGLGPYQWALVAGLMPHNTYVNVFVSGGVIALSGFLLLVVTTLRIGFRAIRFSPPMKNVFIAALAALVGLLVQCLLIDINHWRHFYIIAALVWGLALAADTRGRNAPSKAAGSA